MKNTLVSRRQFLMATGMAAGLAALNFGCRSDNLLVPDVGPEAPDDLQEPPRIAAVGGVLSAALTIATNQITIAGRTVKEPVTYNGLACGPTLVLRAGSQ